MSNQKVLDVGHNNLRWAFIGSTDDIINSERPTEPTIPLPPDSERSTVDLPNPPSEPFMPEDTAIGSHIKRAKVLLHDIIRVIMGK